MTETETIGLLTQVLELLAKSGVPSTFDFEQALLGLDCGGAEAELLADYLPSACGRAFLRELGIVTSDTYQLPNKDGSWGKPQRFSENPLWMSVEKFVESLRTDSADSRNRFSLAAQHSAEVGAVNKAINAGTSLAELRGSRAATVFVAALKHS